MPGMKIGASGKLEAGFEMLAASIVPMTASVL